MKAWIALGNVSFVLLSAVIFPPVVAWSYIRKPGRKHFTTVSAWGALIDLIKGE